MLLLAWRRAGIGGCVGSIISLIVIIGDRFDLWDTDIKAVCLFIVTGIIIGAGTALFVRYSDNQIARSIDRRSNLEDRLTTAYEIEKSDRFFEALEAETAPRLSTVKPQDLYLLRFYPAHFWCAGLVVTCALLFLILETPIFLPMARRIEAEDLRHQAVQIQQVTAPFLKQADKPGAGTDDKQLAKGIRQFIHDLQRGHLTKQEALIRANQLAAQAKQVEEKRNEAISAAIQQGSMAGQKLSEMAQNSSLQKTEEAKLADQASSLEKQISDLQSELNAAEAGKTPMSQSEKDALKSKISELQKELQRIKISERAAEMMAKLMALPDYKAAQKLMEERAEQQEAMNLLLKLQQQDTPQQDGQQQQLTPEQLKAMADRLDQLAQQLNTDAKLRAYAKALLEAAKEAKMGNQQGLSVAIDNAFGLDQSYNGAPPDYGGNGRGSTAPGTWVGDHGKLNRSNKSTMLKIKFQEHIVTSQRGHNGPETYEEQMGPAQLNAKSGIPYQAMLPKYEKTAESAMSKGDIPPEMRTKVKDYFDSLHRGP
jgi:hypothetical protein